MQLIAKPLPLYSRSYQSGFSLVELLVGLVIGLLVTLVVMQVFSEFEGQKRTTMGSADAQTNGNIALYNVQRDVQLAGYGLPVFAKTNSPLLCTTFTPAGTSLSPVTITDGGAGAGASDIVTVRYGTTPLGGVPVSIGPPTTTTAPAVMVGVANNMGCQVGDTAVVSSATSCVLTKVIGPTDIASPAVVSTYGTVNIELQNGTGVVSGASVSCMGGWNSFTYAVNNGQLERNGVPSVAGIVNMQAQYGISSAGNDNKITEWVSATGSTWGPTITVANRNRIKAVRIAIVARNDLLEKDVVTSGCSSTSAANPTGLCAWDATSVSPITASPAPTIDLSKTASGVDNPNWQRYRYRVYETIIPIRSMIWSKDAL